MPNIGKYMMKVLNGESNGSEKDKAWGWKSKAELRTPSQFARKELRDFEDGVAGTAARL